MLSQINAIIDKYIYTHTHTYIIDNIFSMMNKNLNGIKKKIQSFQLSVLIQKFINS